jgi:UDP-N-acetylglucosamine acyltransferase
MALVGDRPRARRKLMIHPTAIVDRRADLAEGVEIGPYAVIEGRVVIGPRTVVGPYTVIKGHAGIGAGCKLGPGAFIGLDPQHRGYSGAETSVEIGEGCIIREGASVNRAFQPGHSTRIGPRCMMMGQSHVGHDCVLGADVTLANCVLVGGHCQIGNGVFLGGGCGIHQFVRIGRLAIVAGNEGITRDVPPFAAVRYGGLKGYNAIGCKRAGMSRASIHAIRGAFRALHTHRTTPAALEAIQTRWGDVPEVRELLEFARARGRGLHPSYRFARAGSTGGASGSEDGDIS